MQFIRNIEFKNLLLDLVITLLAFEYLDISSVVQSTLHLAVYFIIIVQSFALFLMWGEETILEDADAPKHLSFLDKLRFDLTLYFRHFAMFSWVFVCIWVMVPIWHLRVKTGEDFRWAVRASVIISVVGGIILMIRFFSTDVERKQIDDWKAKSASEKHPVQNFLINVYEFLIYKNIGTQRFRDWLAFLIVSGFLVYTETVFEIITSESSVSLPYVAAGILFSYFPMRLLILVKTPFSLIELASALIAFAVFVYMLFF